MRALFVECLGIKIALLYVLQFFYIESKKHDARRGVDTVKGRAAAWSLRNSCIACFSTQATAVSRKLQH